MGNTEIHLSPGQISAIYPVFQKGIRVETTIGASLHELFHDVWKFPRPCVENRISTVFLNGKPVDDLRSAFVTTGAVVALSSAMPGLVGATMRRGGALAALRGDISHRGENRAPETGKGTITVKLFNTLIKELGPVFLRIGFQIDGGDLAGLLPDAPVASGGTITVSGE